MPPNLQQRVQQSLAMLTPRADEVETVFRRELCALEPRLRMLFANGVHAPDRTLMDTIEAATQRLNQPETLLPMLHDLGQRYASYGVAVKDYDSIGLALIRTLELTLGPNFDRELRAAWIRVYRDLASAMIHASVARAA